MEESSRTREASGPSTGDNNKPSSSTAGVSDFQINDKVLSIKLVDSLPRTGDPHSPWVVQLDANEEMDSFDELFPNPAFTYPFELDTFQKQALLCLERHDNVFVAAHTSAGKTVVAEYAIGMALKRNHTKVIYTSPVKALSNQKYRDFKQTFGKDEVGILTGDVQINPEAPCLIMTTEILLQMLYDSSDVIRDLEWVIFDEVHYCNDPDRGHVWEKTFILLPSHISLVLLSATVANISQFADWLGRTREKKTYVISTTKRPVPLEHYLFIGKSSKGKEEKFLFVSEEGKLVDLGYREALTAMREKESSFEKKFGPKGPSPQMERNYLIGMIRHLEKDDRLPLIIFTLSRKRCDFNAGSLASAMDLTTGEEKGRIHQFISRSLSKLKPHDRKIKQVVELTDLLKRGFGVHHSGVLPLLKEITEILFTQGLVKVLFATETFAMGVNMPARSVAFDSVEKHDGTQVRNLSASEYIQMAGRAGRRGKDKTGTVLVMCKRSLPEISELQKMALGKPAHLQSQFRLTYGMILNLIQTRQNVNSIESIMSRSFIEHGKQLALKETQNRKTDLEKKISDIPVPECDFCCSDLDSFSHSYLDYVGWLDQVMPDMIKAAVDKKVMSTGRVVLFESDHHPFTMGVVLDWKKGPRGSFNFTVLAVDATELLTNGPKLSGLKLSEVTTISSNQLHTIFQTFQGFDINGISVPRERSDPPEERTFTQKAINSLYAYLKERNHELNMSSPSGLFLLPHIDPRKDLKINSLAFIEKVDKVHLARGKMLRHICLDCPSFKEHVKIGMTRANLQLELNEVNFDLSPESMKYLPEYKQRIKVLEHLGYINKDGLLELKGKVACLFSEHEVVLTEMIFNNTLKDLTIEEIAGLLSGFVFQQKVEDCPIPPSGTNLKKAIDQAIAVATSIGEVQRKCEMKETVDDFVEQLHFGLAFLAYEWAGGKTFKDLVENSNVQEGIIVRTLQRLDEVIQDIKSAAEVYGDTPLGDGTSIVERMQQCSQAIRRDIVFAASLYTQGDEEDEYPSHDYTEN